MLHVRQITRYNETIVDKLELKRARSYAVLHNIIIKSAHLDIDIPPRKRLNQLKLIFFICRMQLSLKDPSSKTVVLLSFVEELTYDEIAEYINCPVGTVRSRIHRGRLLLRQNLLNFATENGYV